MSDWHKLYFWNTWVGPFYIAERDGRFHVVFDDKSIGEYVGPQQAAEDVAAGRCASITGGKDTSTLHIPEMLSEWHWLRRAA